MNAALIEPVLLLILDILGKTITGGQAGKIIDIIEAWLPIIIKTLPNLYGKVQEIVALLKGQDVLTPEQIDRINAMNMDSDAAFDAALAQAQKEV